MNTEQMTELLDTLNINDLALLQEKKGNRVVY